MFWFKRRVEQWAPTISQKALFLKWSNYFLVFSLSLFFCTLYKENFFYWDIFSARDVLRASAWLGGQFHWPGPELSGGNNLPGPFFYFLLFPPLFFGDNIYSQSFLWLIIWLSLTYTVAFSFVSKITVHKESLLIFFIVFIASLNSRFVPSLEQYWNPSFAIMFHILALMGLYYWTEKNKNLYLCLTGLVIALGMQVHLLVAVHTVTALLFYIFDQTARRRIMPLFLFLLLVSFPVLLYNVMSYFQIFEASEMHHVRQIHWLIEQIFSDEWIKNIKQAIGFYVLIPFGFCFVLTLWQKRKMKKWPITQSTKNLFVILVAPLLLAILVAGIDWYVLFVPVFLVLLLSKWLDDLMPHKSDKKMNFLLVYSLLTLICCLPPFKDYFISFFSPYSLFNIMDGHYILIFLFVLFTMLVINIKWEKKNFYKIIPLCVLFFLLGQVNVLKYFSPRKPPVKEAFSRSRPSYQNLYPLLEKIYLETNWTPKTAMKRIHRIWINRDLSLLAYYAMVGESLKKDIRTGLPIEDNVSSGSDLFSEKPQGYMIIQHLKMFVNWDQEAWSHYLSQSSLLSDDLRQEIAEGRVIIKKPELYNLYWLIPYNVTEKSIFVEGFSNMGQPYYWEEPEWLKNCQQTKKFNNENGLFYCRILPGYLQRAGIHIRFSKSTMSNASFSPLFLDMQFSGPLIGVTSCYSSLEGYTLWSDVHLALFCNKKIFHYTLPDIGSDGCNTWKDIKKIAKIAVAPLRLRVPIGGSSKARQECKEEHIEKIEITFNETHEDQNVQVVWKLK